MSKGIGYNFMNARKEFDKFPTYPESKYVKISKRKNNRRNNSNKYKDNRISVNVRRNKLDNNIYSKRNKDILTKLLSLSKLLVSGLLICAIHLKGMDKEKRGINEPEEYTDFGGIEGKFDNNTEIGRIKNKIIAESERRGLDPNLALAVAKQESQFNPKAMNKNSGAYGLFQLMPETAKELGVDRYNEDDNIKGGVIYLKKLIDMYNGDERKALAAYNWGMGNVARKGMDAMPKETQKYIPMVLGYKEQFKRERNKKINSEHYSKPFAQKGGKVGRYTLGRNVKISSKMKVYLDKVGGTGHITSGLRGNSTSLKSHTSGNKIDVAISNNKHDIIKTAVPFMLNPATVHVSFECLGPRPNPFNSNEAKRKATITSKKIADQIVSEIISKYPEIYQRINSGELKAITDWGWMYGTGPHLDILIDPNKVIEKDIHRNENIELAKNNINKTKAIELKPLIVEHPNNPLNAEDNKPLNNNQNILSNDKSSIITGALGNISLTQTYKKNKKRFN